MKDGEAGHDVNIKASIAMPLLQRNPWNQDSPETPTPYYMHYTVQLSSFHALRRARLSASVQFLLLADITPGSLPPYVGSPSKHSLDSLCRGHCWADVEIEDGLAVLIRLSRIVVDNIANLFLLAIDVARNVPVVAIKGELGATVTSQHEKQTTEQVSQLTQTWRDISSP